MPKIESTGDALAASAAILAACAGGDLTPSEAAEIMALVSTHIRALEVTEIEAKLAALEERMPQS